MTEPQRPIRIMNGRPLKRSAGQRRSTHLTNEWAGAHYESLSCPADYRTSEAT